MGWKSRSLLLATVALALLALAPRSAFSPGSVPASALGGLTPNCVPYANASGVLVCTSSPTYTPATGLSVPDGGDGTRGLSIFVNTTACPEPPAGSVNICGVGTAGSEIPQIRFHGDTAKQVALTTDNVGGTSFNDSAFEVHNLSDSTKKIVLDASGLTTGKTVTLVGVGTASSTITLPSKSATLQAVGDPITLDPVAAPADCPLAESEGGVALCKVSNDPTLYTRADGGVTYASTAQRVYTVATLPDPITNLGGPFLVVDAASSSDCSTGAGSSVARCVSNGISYVSSPYLGPAFFADKSFAIYDSTDPTKVAQFNASELPHGGWPSSVVNFTLPGASGTLLTENNVGDFVPDPMVAVLANVGITTSTTGVSPAGKLTLADLTQTHPILPPVGDVGLVYYFYDLGLGTIGFDTASIGDVLGTYLVTAVPANETDAAHDTCAEISGCVENASKAHATSPTIGVIATVSCTTQCTALVCFGGAAATCTKSYREVAGVPTANDCSNTTGDGLCVCACS